MAAATGDIFVPTDTFTASAGTNLNTYNANWGASVGDATVAKINASGRVYTTAGAFGQTIHLHAAVPTSAEYDVRADWFAPNTNNNQAALLARASGTTGGGTFTAYKAMVLNGSIELQKTVNNADTNIGFYGRSVSAPGTEAIELRCLNGSKKVFLNGVEIITNPDNVITAPGKAGLWLRPIVEAGSSTTGWNVDNFQAQDTQVAPTNYRQTIIS